MTGGHCPEPHSSPAFLLQRFLVEAPPARRPLYWRMRRQGLTVPRATVTEKGGLAIGEHTTISFDSYFNTFFEATWRRHTRLSTLTLQLAIDGECDIRVFRRTAGEKILLAERTAAGPTTDLHFDDEGLHFRQLGHLSLEVSTRETPVVWRSGQWICHGAMRPPVGLALVFCTFNREQDISRLLASLGGDAALVERLARVYVVNQGRPFGATCVQGAARHLGNKLRVVEQGNFGGAGGFTRGILACLEDQGVTHVALLDDDIELEPDCLLRMAAFFQMAKSDIVVGGQMLDAARPTRLYEAGAVISERHWAFQPQFLNLDLANPANLAPIGQPNAIHYNGWWCCGVPLALFREVGLPMPCFIRGDDVELGLRLHQQNIPTVSVAGIGVWHQPFYLKLGGWHLYYETRNMLITAALHQPLGRWGVVRRMLRHFLVHLLTFRYHSAALILQGVNDFLAGPAILRGSPQAVHAGLERHRKLYPVGETPRERVLHEQPMDRLRPLRGRAAYLWVFAKLMVQHACIPTRDGPPRLLPLERFNWPTMLGVDHVAVETWHDPALPTFRRSRESFRALGRQALAVFGRLYIRGPAAATAWRNGFPELVTPSFWKRYLGLSQVHSKPRVREDAD